MNGLVRPYHNEHRMTALPREVGGRVAYLCEALRADGPRAVRCGVSAVRIAVPSEPS